MPADVGVDQEVVVAVDLAVVVEVAVEPAGPALRREALSMVEVVVAVDLPFEVRVAGVGVHDHHVTAGEGVIGEDAAG